MTNKRLEYIDLARTLAIFSVLMYHFPLRDEIWGIRAFINTYFLSLLFFISGFLLHPKAEVKWISEKAKRLLVPLSAFLVLYIPFLSVYKDFSILDTICMIFTEEKKGGYWFIFTLFASFFIIWLANYSYKQCKMRKWAYCTLLIIPWFISIALSVLLSREISYAFSIPSFRRYYLFILLGMIFQNEKIRSLLLINTYYYLIMTLYIVGIIISMWRFPIVDSGISYIVWMITNAAGCLCIIETCKRICNHGTLPKWITWISIDSIGIYLGHYFFVYATQPYLIKIPISPYVTCLPYTFMLLFLSLAITRLIHKNKITSSLFLGQ